MGVLEDLGYYDQLDSDSPAFDEFSTGTVPQPSMLESLGYDVEGTVLDEPTPEAKALSDGSMLDYLGYSDQGYGGGWEAPQGAPQAAPTEKPELTLGRAGGAIVEGSKDVARSYVDFLQGVNEAANRLKHEIPYYDDGGAIRDFVDFAMKYHPILGPLTRPEFGEALYRLGKSDVLAQDPDYLNSSGWVEDFLRAGPQIGAMVLANLLAGPAVGMASMGAMIAGQTYRTAVDAGADPEDAMAWGIANAVIQTPLEQIGLNKALAFWDPKKKIVLGIKDVVEVAGAEWLTEFIQSFPDEFINIFSTQPDKPMLDKTQEFISKLGEIAKQGAYEGTLTAPWSLLTMGAGYARNKYRKGAPKPDPNAKPTTEPEEPGGPTGPQAPPSPEFTSEPYEEFNDADLEALAQMGMNVGGAPANMTPEEYSAQLLQHLENMDYNEAFDQEFERRRGNMRQILDDIMKSAEVAKQEKELELEWEKGQEKYRKHLEYLKAAHKQREDYEKQHRLDIKLQQDIAKSRQKFQESIDFISSKGLESVAPKSVSKEDYKLLREKMGERADWFYEADTSLIPHGHRAAFNLLEREANAGSPRKTVYVNELGAKDNMTGEPVSKSSTYPDWFRQPFRAGQKPKYVFSIDDFNNLMGKLKRGETLTSRQEDMFDRLLKVSEEKQKTEPELYQAADLEALEEEGFRVTAGEPTFWGAVGVGNRVVVKNTDGTWEDYQMVGEENGEAIFANEAKEFRKPATEKTQSIIAYRADDEWIADRYTDQVPYEGLLPTEKKREKEYTDEDFEFPPKETAPEAAEDAFPVEGEQVPSEKKLPTKERRREAKRLAWDAPFREEWLNAQDMSQEDFIDYGEAMVEEGNSDFSQFSQRMGKKIEKDTPLTEALKLIHARVQAGMPPAKKISEMTSEEVKAAAATDYLTGLRNRQAFEQEDEQKQHIVSIDLDALKWINDNLGHHVGDGMLILFGDAMRASGLDEANLYHISGDEYLMQHDDRAALEEGIEKVNEYLAQNPLNVVYKGVTIPYNLGVSYGIGETIIEAEAGLEAEKKQRQATGARAERGAIPPQISKGLATGGEAEISKDTGAEQALPEGAERYDLKIPRIREKPTYEEVQAAIDDVEDQLVERKIPSIEWSEIPELNDLYRKRSRVEDVVLVEGLALIPGDTEINYNYLHAETGQKIQGRVNAREALTEVDAQLDDYYSLLECLTNARN